MVSGITVLDTPSDTTPPSGTITSHSSNTTIPAAIADVFGTASDIGSGVDRVRVRLERLNTGEFWNGSAWTASNAFAEADVANNGLSWNLPNVDFTGDGTYRIRLVVIDNAGNSRGVNDNPVVNFIVN